MALFGSSGSSANVDEIKTTIMKQLQQEAAVSNARQLIGVRYKSHPQPICDSSKALAKVKESVLLINCNIESQRALLRQVHSRPQLDAVLERRGMSLDMHGKIHLAVEHC